MIDIDDYLLDQNGKDWGNLLSGWKQFFPKIIRLWLVNRFGDVIAVFEDGTVHFLDVGSGSLVRIADSQDHFYKLIDEGDNALNWLMFPLVDACVAAGMRLRPDQCYGYKIPPFLGGAYDLENIEPTDLNIHYDLLAELWRQVKDLPPGTKIDSVTFT